MNESTKFYLEGCARGLNMKASVTMVIVAFKLLNPHLSHEQAWDQIGRELMEDLNVNGTVKTTTDKIYEATRS